jgi:hypothetical protein
MADYYTRVPFRQANGANHISSEITGRRPSNAGSRADADQHAESRAVVELENSDIRRAALVRDRVDSAVNSHLARHGRR